MALFCVFSCSKLEEALRTSNPHQDPAPIPKKPRILSGIFVDSNSTAVGPQKNGKTWANAYNTIQEAVDNASNGSSIIIAKGDYTEDIVFDNKNGINITGGYSVGDTLEKDFIKDDFKADADWVTINGSMTIENGSSNIAVVSGLRFKKQNNTRTVLINGTNDKKISNITLNNIKFIGDSTPGGGMDVKHTAGLTVSYASFEQIENDNGGCLNIENSQNITISSSNFKKCVATDSGGALKIVDSNFIKISSSEFEDNKALNNGGGAIDFEDSSNVTIQSTHFKTHACATGGGAVSFVGPLLKGIPTARLRLENVSFNSSSSTNGGALFAQNIASLHMNFGKSLNEGSIATNEGGMVYVDNAQEVNINDGIFKKNTAETGAGGAFYFTNITEKIIISNNEFIQNMTEKHDAGAIAFNSNKARIDLNNNKFTGNTSKNNGGAISIVDQRNEVYFTDNIFYKNKAKNFGGALYLEANDVGAKSRYIIRGKDNKTCNFEENKSKSKEGGGAVYLLSDNTVYNGTAYTVSRFNRAEVVVPDKDTSARLILEVSGILQNNSVAKASDGTAGNFGSGIAVQGITPYVNDHQFVAALKRIVHYKKGLITAKEGKEIHPIEPPKPLAP